MRSLAGLGTRRAGPLKAQAAAARAAVAIQPETDTDAIRKLRNELSSFLRLARRRRHEVFLELFAGSGRLSARLRKQGYAAMPLDVLYGDHHDVLRRAAENIIIGWLRSKVVQGVWLGTPCSSWSRARRGPPGSGWCTIRDSSNLMGLPNLTDRDKARISLGNRTLAFSCRIISACIALGTPVAMENPATSMLWLVPRLQKLAAHAVAVRYCFDFCQYGAPWRKRTVVMAWHCVPADLNRRCSGHKGLCSRAKRHHIILQGAGPGGRLWTSIAEPYPAPVARAAANMLIASSEALRSQRLHQLVIAHAV